MKARGSLSYICMHVQAVSEGLGSITDTDDKTGIGISSGEQYTLGRIHAATIKWSHFSSASDNIA